MSLFSYCPKCGRQITTASGKCNYCDITSDLEDLRLYEHTKLTSVSDKKSNAIQCIPEPNFYMERGIKGENGFYHNIALVAHDARKQELIDWCKFNVATLVCHKIYATGTTAKLLSDICIEYECQRDNNGNPVKPRYLNITALKSGPLGGDQQIGAMIAEGKIDMLIFFCDNLVTQGHQTDISALTRLASLYNIAFATNRTTADMLITSSLFEDTHYEPIKPNFEKYLNRFSHGKN